MKVRRLNWAWVMHCNVITDLSCIIKKTSISVKWKNIFPNENLHSSVFWKAFQISRNYFSCHVHFNSDVPIDAPECKVKDKTYKQGQSLEVLQDYDSKQLAECHQCTCMDGKLDQCHRIYYCELNKPGCTNFIKSEGQCCPTCARGTWLIE